MSIHKFLTGRVVIERRTSTDAYSGHSYDPASVVPARWFDEVRVVRGVDAREVLSNAHVSLVEFIAAGDRVTPAASITADSTLLTADSTRVTADATVGPDLSQRTREVVAVRRNETTRGVFSHYVGYLA